MFLARKMQPNIFVLLSMNFYRVYLQLEFFMVSLLHFHSLCKAKSALDHFFSFFLFNVGLLNSVRTWFRCTVHLASRVQLAKVTIVILKVIEDFEFPTKIGGFSGWAWLSRILFQIPRLSVHPPFRDSVLLFVHDLFEKLLSIIRLKGEILLRVFSLGLVILFCRLLGATARTFYWCRI